MKKSLKSFLIVTTLAVHSASAAVSFSDTFATDTLSNYTIITGSSQIGYSTSEGVSSGGGLTVTNSGNPSTSFTSNTSFTVGSGITNQLTMSVFLKKSAAGFGGTSQAFLGISNDINYTWGGNATPPFSAIGLVLTSNQIGFRSAVNGGVSGNGGQTANTGSYADGNWYKLTSIITKPVSGDVWTVSGSVEDWGATGASFSSTIATLPTTNVTIADATFNDVATVTYGQFGTRNQAWTAADNFTMVTPAVASNGLVTFRATNGLAADGSQDLLTPANDGVANLLKYAFNMLGSGSGQAVSLSTSNTAALTPGGFAGLPFVGIENGTGKLQITYIRRNSSETPGIAYAVEFSDVLTTWAVNGSATETVTNIDSSFERVTTTDSLGSPAKRFARVQVSPIQ